METGRDRHSVSRRFEFRYLGCSSMSLCRSASRLHSASTAHGNAMPSICLWLFCARQGDLCRADALFSADNLCCNTRPRRPGIFDSEPTLVWPRWWRVAQKAWRSEVLIHLLDPSNTCQKYDEKKTSTMNWSDQMFARSTHFHTYVVETKFHAYLVETKKERPKEKTDKNKNRHDRR